MRKKSKIVTVYILEVSTKYKRSLYTTPFKLKKMLWYGELSDSDLFTPSCPHLHSLDGKYKLNVYKGEIYDICRKRVLNDKRVDDNELSKLWNEPGFLQFAYKMRGIYSERFPTSTLPPIPIYCTNGKQVCIHAFRLESKARIFQQRKALYRSTYNKRHDFKKSLTGHDLRQGCLYL